jgi:hypothetical protein
MRVVTGTPSSFDPVRKVAPQPFEDTLGQRGDDDLVEAGVLQRGLDGVELVGLADHPVDRPARRALEQRDGGLKRQSAPSLRGSRTRAGVLDPHPLETTMLVSIEAMRGPPSESRVPGG